MAALIDVLPHEEVRRPDGVGEAVPYLRLRQNGELGALLPPDAQVVNVCTPNASHAELGLAALRAGRHVVLEKPMGLRAADCRKVIDEAERRGLHLFGVMQNRYSPAGRWLKDRLLENAFGRILQVHVNCFWNRDERYYRIGDRAHPWHGDAELDGGVLYTQFAHFIDLLYWGFGRPRVLSARFANQTHVGIHDFPDTGMVHFELPGGGLGSLNFSTVIHGRNFESTLTVIGTCGTVKLGGQYMNELRYCHVEGLVPPRLPPSRPGNDYGGYVGSAANHHFVIDNVVEVLLDDGEVACTGAEGLAVVEIIEEIYSFQDE